MNQELAISYINQMLIDEYNLIQDRKSDSNYESDKDLKEATESELDEIVNAQRFMDRLSEEDI
jgi:predicted RNA-binding protein with PIN domain